MLCDDLHHPNSPSGCTPMKFPLGVHSDLREQSKCSEHSVTVVKQLLFAELSSGNSATSATIDRRKPV